MSENEIDDNDFFHQDFTTASKWEVFNSCLGELFLEWKLPFTKTQPEMERHQLSECKWQKEKELLTFADSEFEIIHYKANIPEMATSETEGDDTRQPHQVFIDLLSAKNNFCLVDEHGTDVHPLARWYGLREFVVISPVANKLNESQVRILLSSMHISVAESHTEVPVFVQVLKKDQNVFLGVCETPSMRVSFDIVHLYQVPPSCKYMSDLVDLFKGKIGIKYAKASEVSMRYTFKIGKFRNAAYVPDKTIVFTADDDDEPDPEDDGFKNRILPFGTSIDPVKEFHLHCTWPHINPDAVIDTQSHSEFNARDASIHSMRALFEPNPICYASECISDFLYHSASRVNITEYYPHLVIDVSTNAKPLDKIADSASLLPSLSLSSTHGQDEKRLEGPIADSKIMTMLYYLFPDAQIEPRNMYAIPESEPFDAMRIKSGPTDSLVHRLSVLLAVANAHLGGPRAMAQLWVEFTQEMRYRIEKNVQIPGVSTGFPDSRTCLLHQKLQMLNICMERKRIREGGLPFALTSPTKKVKEHDSDDEFFDCNEADDARQDPKTPAWDQPVGRLSKLGKMLLVNSDEPLYIPVTQEPVPKTEDQLEDDAEVMLKLGSSSELRAQMMSASLFSDMESFKAANPAATLEDFIRWYSPRDWIEVDCDERDPFSRKGHLSERMQIPGNTWQTTWEQARPVPAHRQRRLFDDTKEAEKVLHFLESTTIGQICQMTIACLFHAVIVRVRDEGTEYSDTIPSWNENISKVLQMCCRLSRDGWNNPNARGNSRDNWTTLLNEITNLEYAIVQAKSLKMKIAPDSKTLGEEKSIIASLMKSLETELEHSAVINRIFSMRNSEVTDPESNHRALSPHEKQFILRLSGKLENKLDGGPQFMRAIVKNDEIRLCGAFSQDTTFI